MMNTLLIAALGVFQLAAAAPTSNITPTVVIPPTSTSGLPYGTSGVINPVGQPEPVNTYPNNGKLNAPTPAPYTPAGGVNVNSTPPVYQAFSDFDWQSLNLALNQEWIELDLFQEGLKRFPVEEFEAWGLNASDRQLIEFMAEQEVGHATLLTNILGPAAAKRCTYNYPFTNVAEFVDFCQKLTRWGESGVYGFLPHLDSRPSAQLLLQSISTEARQQMIFRQFEGLFPMPVWFEVGIPQSWAWTLLAPYITSCPAENPHLVWQNFPALNITNNPNATNPSFRPAITNTRPKISSPGREVTFAWENPGKTVSWNGTYVTNTTALAPKFAAWVSQLNVTYTPLYDIVNNTAKAKQPAGNVFDERDPLVNGTVFVALTDNDLFLTPHNISLINPRVVAGPALYQSG